MTSTNNLMYHGLMGVPMLRHSLLKQYAPEKLFIFHKFWSDLFNFASLTLIPLTRCTGAPLAAVSCSLLGFSSDLWWVHWFKVKQGLWKYVGNEVHYLDNWECFRLFHSLLKTCFFFVKYLFKPSLWGRGKWLFNHKTKCCFYEIVTVFYIDFECFFRVNS